MNGKDADGKPRKTSAGQPLATLKEEGPGCKEENEKGRASEVVGEKLGLGRYAVEWSAELTKVIEVLEKTGQEEVAARLASMIDEDGFKPAHEEMVAVANRYVEQAGQVSLELATRLREARDAGEKPPSRFGPSPRAEKYTAHAGA